MLTIDRPYITDPALRQAVAEHGYAIVPFLNTAQIEKLRALYHASHDVRHPGYFFSIFNSDIEYRKHMLQTSVNIAADSLRQFFNQYKIGYSGFVVRGPNDEGEFFIHQDPSFVDETKFAPLHIWCPLYDIALDFSPLCVVPQSHKLSSEYRSLSIPAPFEEIRNELRPYLKPLLVKAGEVIFLDPRLIHNSLPNKRDVARPVLLIQMFPEQADYYTPYLKDGALEIYRLPEDYFVSNSNFYVGVDDKPALGEFAYSLPYTPYKISLPMFQEFCARQHLYPENYVAQNLNATEGFIHPIH